MERIFHAPLSINESYMRKVVLKISVILFCVLMIPLSLLWLFSPGFRRRVFLEYNALRYSTIPRSELSYKPRLGESSENFYKSGRRYLTTGTKLTILDMDNSEYVSFWGRVTELQPSFWIDEIGTEAASLLPPNGQAIDQRTRKIAISNYGEMRFITIPDNTLIERQTTTIRDGKIDKVKWNKVSLSDIRVNDYVIFENRGNQYSIKVRTIYE